MLEPLLLKSGEEVTDNISKIFDVHNVVKIENTILDPEVQMNGVYIELGREISCNYGEFTKVFLPPCPTHAEEDIIVLDDISVRANNLLRVIKLVDSGEKSPAALKKSLVKYLRMVAGRLVGKSGVLCRNILGRRVQNSGRAVLLPSMDTDPSRVYVPGRLMRRMGIEDGEIILVGRDPTIWTGSVEAVRAYKHKEDVIRLHPFVFSQFGADCDGDTVWCMKIPEEHQSMMESQVLKFTKRHALTIKCASAGLPPVEIDWSNPAIASTAMANTTGFSVGPLDILEDSEDLARFKEATGKDIGDEARSICHGLSYEDYAKYLVTINQTMLIQKVYLGPVGSAAQKLKLIAGRNELLRDSANYISERTQQMLFDVKGSIKGDTRDLDIFFELLDIVNMSGEYSSTDRMVTHKSVLARLESFGLNADACKPMIVYMYTGFPLFQAIWDISSAEKIKNGFTDEQRQALIKEASIILSDPDNVKAVIDSIASRLGVVGSVLIRTAAEIKAKLSLGMILRDPVFSLINPFSEKKMIQDLNYLNQFMSNGPFDSRRLTDWIITKSMEYENVRTEPAGESSESTRVQLQSEDRG